MEILSFKKGMRCPVPLEQEYVGINRKMKVIAH